MELESIRFDLQTCIQDVIQLFGRKAHEKGIGLWSSFPFWIPSRVVGDPTRIKQVLTNLISNAIKFTHTGQVYVSVSFSESEEGQSLFTISVEDSGIGMSQDVMDHLFEEYMQADKSTARRFGGTGLGLQIGSKLSTLMGGSISVESIEGKGSQFSLTLPLETVPDAGEYLLKIDTAELESRAVHVVDARGDAVHLTAILKNYVSALNLYPSVETFLANASVSETDVLVYNIDQLSARTTEHCQMIDNETGHALAKILISHTYRNPTTMEARPYNIRGHITMPVDVYEFIYALTLVCRERVFRAEMPVVTRQYIREQRDLVHGDHLAELGSLHGRVLLAEDNAVNQRVTQVILKRLGLDVDVVENGAEAVEKATAGDYDAILMDCMMPELDGAEATKIIRSLEVNTRAGGPVPIIATTATLSDEEIKRSMDAGMNDYLPKPARPSEVFSVLKKWLRTVSGGIGS